MGSKSGRRRPLWTETKHKLWVTFHLSALTRALCIKPKAFHITNSHILKSESKKPPRKTNIIFKPFYFWLTDLDPTHTSERFEAARVALFHHDTLCEAWSFFLLCWNPHLEHAISWGATISRPDHFPTSQSQLLRHQRKEEIQSASALHLYSCDRYIHICQHRWEEGYCERLRNGEVTKKSTVKNNHKQAP